ncbi:hypothetical protein DM02DRAFT_662363 [Periconia macrospinosa]|uniref:Uncharacterized protein n=1 Tax=Periconia macrospinosa TaxID=97972 RepID=A0A2V1D4S4_9PLEO|nr:hypothetical protein DM02DRAFT_662363 [Periconia macrospinosa]
MAEVPRMTEMLVGRGAALAGTGALYTAAAFGHLDTLCLLIQHGVELNEVLPSWRNWASMHFAASEGIPEAMKLLEEILRTKTERRLGILSFDPRM